MRLIELLLSHFRTKRFRLLVLVMGLFLCFALILLRTFAVSYFPELWYENPFMPALPVLVVVFAYFATRSIFHDFGKPPSDTRIRSIRSQAPLAFVLLFFVYLWVEVIVTFVTGVFFWITRWYLFS